MPNSIKKIQDENISKKPNIYLYWPNILDYFRFILVVMGFTLGTYYEYHAINASLYMFSHFLDLYDGSLARYLNQCSKFGIILDYTVDIVTEMIWFIQLVPLVPNHIKTLMVYAIVIDISGLVLCVHNSASGKYWKGSKYRPKWQNPFINENGYTRLGYSIVIWYQVFWASLYLSYYYEIPENVLNLLTIPMILELSSLTMILYEQIMLF
jgi:phosphatidylglycerophosphate synthase